MMKYKGYYIDGAVFNSKHDIDEFVKAEAVKGYIKAVELFCADADMARSNYCMMKAKNLVDNFGFTYARVEEIENKAMDDYYSKH